MPAVHTNGHARTCGASTTVQNNSTVFAEGQLIAVDNSFNSHGQGGLIPSGSTVYVEGKLIICHAPDNSRPDSMCPLTPQHCNPQTAQGCGSVFVY